MMRTTSPVIRFRVRSGRPAFTLVEMLVATALILFVMVILSQAFVAGLDTFSQLKSVGDLEERLRVAAGEIRRDLSADHFEGRRKLSDPNFWLLPPREGFFRVVQIGSSAVEGTDDNSIPSYRATNHRLHFTVKLRGNQQEKFFSASVPAGLGEPFSGNQVPTNFFGQARDGRFEDNVAVFNSPWAEIAYFLAPTGTNAGTNTPLFALYRAQLAVVPDNRTLNWPPGPPYPAGLPVNASRFPGYLSLSCEPVNGKIYFNSPSDLATGIRSLENDLLVPVIPQPGPDANGYPNMAGRSTLLVTDVISFDVQVLKRDPAGNLRTDFEDVPHVTTPPDPAYKAVFDTKAPPALPPAGTYFYGHPNALGNASVPATRDNYTVVAVQITLRVWDFKTKQTRQITIIQDL